MIQTLVTAFLVAAAALWVVWSVLLPRPLRARLRRTLLHRSGRLPATAGGKESCGDGCSCGE